MMAMAGVRKRECTRAAAGTNAPSRAIAKYTRGPAVVIALRLLRMITIATIANNSPAAGLNKCQRENDRDGDERLHRQRDRKPACPPRCKRRRIGYARPYPFDIAGQHDRPVCDRAAEPGNKRRPSREECGKAAEGFPQID